MFKSENFLLTFNLSGLSQKTPLPSVGGDEGEGGQNGLYSAHPHPHPPPSKRGRGTGGKISNIFDYNLSRIWCLEFGDYHFPNSSSFFPASGKKRGDPNFSTPKVLTISCVSLETMKSAKAFAPGTLTLGHLAGFTSITW